MKSRRLRRIISGLLLVWLGLLQFPLPMSVRAATAAVVDGKDLSVPFPCMHRACGCKSADQCWKSCCCTTRAERIAFVIQHGLAMPAALKAGSDDGETPPTPKCCQTKKSSACCEQKSACQDGACAPQGADSESSNDQRPARGVVLFDSVMKCRGLTSMLLQFGGALLPEPAAERPERTPAPEFATPGDDSLQGILLSPPAPPPRIC